jgi:LDH2 family malate/lactate/ureidoglycolate dehydrogenase
VLKESGAMSLLHGDDGMGYVVGKAAMEMALKKAEEHSICSVGVIRSNHFGAAALYARMAAEQGYIGIVTTNVIPNVGVVGSKKPAIGNNPIAFSAPTYDEFPFVLDISLSAVSGGKLLLASKRGEKIPTNWAVDPEGNPTDDPDRGFKGTLLPTGGHKGFGLALFVDIICGVINGGVFLQDMKSMYKHKDEPSLTCHQMIVMDPQAFISRDEMKQRMASFVDTLKETPMQEGYEMLIPGELEHRSEQQRRREGIPVSGELYEELMKSARSLGVEQDLPTR